MARRIFAIRPLLPKLPFGFADVALFFGLFLLIHEVAYIGHDFFAEFKPPTHLPVISLDPKMLPYYAARSTLRMFIALLGSILFTLSYGYAAAKNRYAERALIPLLDILQSVPVLAFLTVVTDFLVGLFPGSMLGLELVSIFGAFTAQAWNMTFSFYHSLITLPKDLDETAKLFRLSKWRRFKVVEVPAAMIGLVWNAMMSFGGGWFFVAVSEVVQVGPNKVLLPGLGSYVATAIDHKDWAAMLYASVTMLTIIVIVDQLFWRPVVAWSEKFKMELSSNSDPMRSWVLELIYAAKVPRSLGKLGRGVATWWRQFPRPQWERPSFRHPEEVTRRREMRINGDVVFGATMGAIIVWTCVTAVKFIGHDVKPGEVLPVVGLGFITLARVIFLLVFATIVWTPIGVYIGFNPRLAKFFQPIVQFCSSYPANFIFPAFTVFFLRYHISLDWGAVVLMALGTQWYILFNTIAGAMAVPTVLREMAANMRMKGWPLWRRLIIPAIFPAWVTGAVTASGGAWNASIVAENTQWGNDVLWAHGLGAYLDKNQQDLPRLVLGVTIMCIFVVGINRLVWRRLYRVAETRYRLG